MTGSEASVWLQHIQLMKFTSYLQHLLSSCIAAFADSAFAAGAVTYSIKIKQELQVPHDLEVSVLVEITPAR